MQRKAIIFWGIIVLFIFSLSLTILAKEQVYDFRKVNWGISKEEVEKAEQGIEKLLSEDEHWLGYKERVGGLECNLWYEFFHNKLVSAAYQFCKEYIDPDGYIYDYRHLRALLKGKYGEPNTAFSDDPTEWEEGESSYWTWWFYPNGEEENNETGISLELYDRSDTEDKPLLQIEYWSIKLIPWIREMEKREANEKL